MNRRDREAISTGESVVDDDTWAGGVAALSSPRLHSTNERVAVPHPLPLHEPDSLALVNAPPLVYALHECFWDCCGISLSDAQIVTARRALQGLRAHRAFFLGDGVGTGKGRVIAGVCLDLALRGRPTVWITANVPLVKLAWLELETVFGPRSYWLARKWVSVESYGRYRGKVDKDELRSSLLVLDEAHLARNRTRCRDVVDYAQDAAAAVMYSTATPASDIRRIGYMRALRLWGDGTPFKDFSVFCRVLRKWGLAAMELVGIELKRDGKYICSKLGCAASYSLVSSPLNAAQSEYFDECARSWEHAPCGALKRLFFQRIVTAMKTYNMLRAWEQDIEAGASVVLTYQGTGAAREASHESFLHHLSARAGVAMPLGMERIAGMRGTERAPHPPSGAPASRAFSRFLPCDPLDVVLKHFGAARVAEVSGRRTTLGGERPKPSNASEAAAFRSGAKVVALLTAAGSLGIDLNPQRPIRHYFLEMPWAPETFIQQAGRSYRSNNASPPKYIVVTSNTICETRVEQALAKRARTLGAVTEADRGVHAFAASSDMSTKNLARFLVDLFVLRLAKSHGIGSDLILGANGAQAASTVGTARATRATPNDGSVATLDFETRTALASPMTALNVFCRLALRSADRGMCVAAVVAYVSAHPSMVPLVVPWSPRVHRLFPPAVRRRAVAVLLCRCRAEASRTLGRLPNVAVVSILEFAIGDRWDVDAVFEFFGTLRRKPWERLDVVDFLNSMSAAPSSVQRDVLNDMARYRAPSCVRANIVDASASATDAPHKGGGAGEWPPAPGEEGATGADDRIKTVGDYCFRSKNRAGFAQETRIEQHRGASRATVDFAVTCTTRPVDAPLLFKCSTTHFIVNCALPGVPTPLLGRLESESPASPGCEGVPPRGAGFDAALQRSSSSTGDDWLRMTRPGRAVSYMVLQRAELEQRLLWGPDCEVHESLPLGFLGKFRDQENSFLRRKAEEAADLSMTLHFIVRGALVHWERSMKSVLVCTDTQSRHRVLGLLIRETGHRELARRHVAASSRETTPPPGP
jgi:hypothetical protein